MGFRAVIFISLAAFSFPLVSSAEEPSLIEAMCQQVLEPKEEKSVLGVIKDHLVEKFSDVPEKVVQGAKGTADSAAETLAEKVESQEFDTEVLGASIINPVVNETLDGLSYLLEHWVWTLAALGVVALAFMFL